LPYAVNICPFTTDVPFCSDPHENLNVLCGFLKRISCIQKTITHEATEGLQKTVHDYLLKHYLRGDIKPLPCYENLRAPFFHRWLNQNKNYTCQRKNQLSKEFFILQSCGYRLTNKNYNVHSFIKREFYEEMKFPRLINSRSDAFKVAIAPFISSIEDVIYKQKYFVKHCTPMQIAQKFKTLSKYPYILETDYSSFESCFQLKYCQAVELQLFEFMLQNNPRIFDQIKYCYLHGTKPRTVKLHSDEFIAYSSQSRMSGEMWTSLGNGFSNLMNMKYLCKLHNLKFKGFVEGDDGIFSLTKDSICVDDYSKLGFNIKMKYSQNVTDSAFCGILFDNETNKLLASPEQLSRLGWTCRAQYLRARRPKLLQLLKAKAMSIYATAPCTPILGPLCYKIIQQLPNVVPNFSGLYTKWIVDFNQDWVYQKIPLSSRILYEQKYHISLDQQFVCEQIINDNNFENVQLPFCFLSESNSIYIV